MFDDNRVLDEEYMEETQKGKYLTFTLGEESYGIDILFVTEIVGLQPITVMPDLPPYIKGVVNLRGDIVPVLDARARFGKEVQDYSERTCIIVVDVSGISMGIVVDAVSEVLVIEDENIVPPPVIFSNGVNYIKAIGKKDDQVILLLDCMRILNDEELEYMRTRKDEFQI